MKNRQDTLMKGLMLTSSLAVFCLLAYAAYHENFGTGWYQHQSEYKRQLIALADTDKARLAAERFDVGQKQLYLPDLSRIDRCTTCHISIDNPSMETAAQPLTAHSGQIMLNHPKEQFGCTICHQGQGRATTAAEAHGHVAHWTKPMLAHEEMDQSCAKCHLERSLPDVARYNEAMDLFYEHGCLSCHRVRSRGGNIAADISDAGDIHDAEWHFKHLKDPKSVVETSEMTNFDLSDEQAQSLTFLMMCYSGESIPTDLLPDPSQLTSQMKLPEPLDPLALEGYVGSKFCIGCHGATHPAAVEGWRESKMSSTYERLMAEPVKDNCLPCHATGLNSATGHFSEESVGCEACHGPGREAVRLILANKTEEHKQLIQIDANSKLVCARCHSPHMAMASHAEFYRKLPPPGPQPITKEEPSLVIENKTITARELQAIGQETLPSVVEKGTDTPPGSQPITKKEPSLAMTKKINTPPRPRPITRQEPALVMKKETIASPSISRVSLEESTAIPSLDIIHSYPNLIAPKTLEGGCVSSDCHYTMVSDEFVHGPAAQQQCEACHELANEQNHRFTVPMKEPDLCFQCHELPLKTKFEHGPVALGVCTVCHDPHGARHQFMLPEVKNELCFTCHLNMHEHVNQVRVPHEVFVEKDCMACHDPHRSNFARQLKKDMPGLCLECHEPMREIIEHAVVAHEPLVTESKCANCHNPHGSDLPKILAANEPDLCLNCHDEPMETPTGPIINMKAWIENNPERHGPIREGSCTQCHQPHGSQNFRILTHEFPHKFYAPFSLEVYDLCFQCHEDTLVLEERTWALTDFRNGDKNLHFVHVNQEKGRTCRACHEVHAGTQPKRMKELVPFGQWEYPVGFEQILNGGKCAPGCHVPRVYDREQEITQQ